MPLLSTTLAADLAGLNPADPNYATQFVEALLSLAQQRGASDIHLQPVENALDVLLRIDGVLQPLGSFPRATRTSVVARLKVLASLLTYRTDVPQEGRLPSGSLETEMRVSTFPTLYGERAVVRLFAATGKLERLADLGLPEEIRAALQELIGETAGAVLVCGPAGSGKTTTLYACVREIVAAGGQRSIVTLEDPVESVVEGAAQAPIQPAAGFDFATGLRSLMRQDPEVVLLGEIRDRVTAEVAFQAALTGQLLLSSFHAGSAAAALSRLTDMDIEPYLLRSGLLAVLCQRLLRRLCESCRVSQDSADRLGLDATSVKVPVGCPKCAGTGYRGRMVIAEMLAPRGAVGRAVLRRRDAAAIERCAVREGMVGLRQRAIQAVEAGQTSPAEVRRVLGYGESTP